MKIAALCAIDFLLPRPVFLPYRRSLCAFGRFHGRFLVKDTLAHLGRVYAVIIVDHATHRATGNSREILVNFDPPNDVL